MLTDAVEKIKITDILRTSMRCVERNFAPFFAVVAVIVVPIEVLSTVAVNSEKMEDDPTLIFQHPGVLIAGALGMIVSWFLSFLANGALVHGVIADIRGQKNTFKECISSAWHQLRPLINTSLYMSIGMGIASLLCLVPGIFLWVMWSVALPVTMAEKLGSMDALGRSAFLTEGNRVTIFGLCLIILLGSVTFNVLVSQLLSPFGTGNIYGQLVTQTAISLAQASTVVVSATVTGVLYSKLRLIKEGVDVTQIVSVFE